MRSITKIAFLTAGLALAATACAQEEGRGQRLTVWEPVPVADSPWIPPNKPLTKLADLLSKHAGQPNWSETIVNDELFRGEYISMGPGVKTPRRFDHDNRAWWIIQDGQIRFEVEGQQPFVASKGYMVQVPHRLVYSMATVGEKPSLRFEVTIARSAVGYPIDETPVPIPGQKYIKTTIADIKGSYDDANVPYIDYNATIGGHPVPKKNQNQFINDSHGIANIIRGDPKKQPPARDVDKGHLHETGPEFWFILEGQMEYKIGSVPTFVADQGDIVYAPKQVWHRVRFAGNSMATRLAVVGYANSHVFQTPEELQGNTR